jgi:hypothetical protein
MTISFRPRRRVRFFCAGRCATLVVAAAGAWSSTAAPAAGWAQAREHRRADRGALIGSPPPVTVSLRPYLPADPPGNPAFLRVLALEATPRASGAIELFVDRRLVRLEIEESHAGSGVPTPGRRRRGIHVCVHPDAPRWRREWVRIPPPRMRVFDVGGGATTRRLVAEWIDMREYCSGAARAALARGGTLRVFYGFGRRRTASTDAERGGAYVARVLGPGGDPTRAFAWLGPHEEVLSPVVGTTSRQSGGAGSSPVAQAAAEVGLHVRDRASAKGAAVDVSVRSIGVAAWVYLRPDQLSLRVRGPLGVVRCAPPRLPIAPIVDFFRRVTPRRPATMRVDLGFLCPRGTFDLAGVYELSPVLELPHAHPSGDASLVGVFEGAPFPFVVVRGERGYVERVPEEGSRP